MRENNFWDDPIDNWAERHPVLAAVVAFAMFYMLVFLVFLF